MNPFYQLTAQEDLNLQEAREVWIHLYASVSAEHRRDFHSKAKSGFISKDLVIQGKSTRAAAGWQCVKQ